MKGFIKFLSHPAWGGISGFFTILGVLIALGLGSVLIAFVTGIFHRIQDLLLWLLEPMTSPRYILLAGIIVLIAFTVTTIQPYLSSSAKLSHTKKKNISKITPRSLPVLLPAGIGNAYLQERYLDLPSEIVTSKGVEFKIKPDSLIVDTAKIIRVVLPRDDGFEEFGFSAGKIQNVKAAYFLINSGNSQSFYRSFKVGEIKLVFKDAPPIVTPLILGKNIREWCIGNPGDLIRDVSDHQVSQVAWKGTNLDGTTAVMDSLKIPIFEIMRGNSLEEIYFAHNKKKHSSDTLGVHFSIFAISLEIEQQ